MKIHATIPTSFFFIFSIVVVILPAYAEPSKVKQEPIPDEIWQEMQGKSWHAKLNCSAPGGCKCPSRNKLVLLTIPYWDFSGNEQSGKMIVSKTVSKSVSDVFQNIFDSKKFYIERIELVDAYGGNDDVSMAANNTSAFNCRLVTGGNRLSEHSFGTAIDINPIQNPYVKGSTTLPPAGKDFDTPQERNGGHVGLISQGDVVHKAFDAIGWKWGGEWPNKKDYQHFSESGK